MQLSIPLLLKTRKYEVDLNGNQTAAEERDWTSWDGTNEPPAPEPGALLRRTQTAMVFSTPAASDTAPASPDPDSYTELTGTQVVGRVDLRTVENGSGAMAESRRFGYDANGNVLTESVRDVRPGVDAWWVAASYTCRAIP